jgi:hypothetical protein
MLQRSTPFWVKFIDKCMPMSSVIAEKDVKMQLAWPLSIDSDLVT